MFFFIYVVVFSLKMAEITLDFEDDFQLSEDEDNAAGSPARSPGTPLQDEGPGIPVAAKAVTLKSVVVVPPVTTANEEEEARKALLKRNPPTQLDGKFLCEVKPCKKKQKTFQSIGSLHRHWAEVHQPLILLYACPQAATANCRWQKRPQEIISHMVATHPNEYPSVEKAKEACQPRGKLPQGVRKNVAYIPPEGVGCPFKMRQPRKEDNSPCLPASRKRATRDISADSTPQKQRKTNQIPVLCLEKVDEPSNIVEIIEIDLHAELSAVQAIIAEKRKEEESLMAKIRTKDLDKANQEIRQLKAKEIAQKLGNEKLERELVEMRQQLEKAEKRVKKTEELTKKVYTDKIRSLEGALKLKDNQVEEMRKEVREHREERRDLEARLRRATEVTVPEFPEIEEEVAKSLPPDEDDSTSPPRGEDVDCRSWKEGTPYGPLFPDERRTFPPPASTVSPDGVIAPPAGDVEPGMAAVLNSEGKPDARRMMAMLQGLTSLMQHHFPES